MRDISAAFHVDLSTAMVYVADLLRFRCRHGDFYFFDKRADNFPCAADNLPAESDFLADSARRNNLLLHDVALPVARVADGNLFNKLARIDRISPRNDRFSDNRADFFADWIFFAVNLQVSQKISANVDVWHKKNFRSSHCNAGKFRRADFLCAANVNGGFVAHGDRLRRANATLQ